MRPLGMALRALERMDFGTKVLLCIITVAVLYGIVGLLALFGLLFDLSH